MLRTLGVVLLVLCVAAGIAVWRGWLTVSEATGASRPGPHVAVDQDKVQDDLQKVGGVLVDKLVVGSIRVLDVPNQVLRVADEKRELTLKVTSATAIKRGDRPLSFADLKLDDSVSVAYQTTGETHVARRITLAKDP